MNELVLQKTIITFNHTPDTVIDLLFIAEGKNDSTVLYVLTEYKRDASSDCFLVVE